MERFSCCDGEDEDEKTRCRKPRERERPGTRSSQAGQRAGQEWCRYAYREQRHERGGGVDRAMAGHGDIVGSRIYGVRWGNTADVSMAAANTHNKTTRG